MARVVHGDNCLRGLNMLHHPRGSDQALLAPDAREIRITFLTGAVIVGLVATGFAISSAQANANRQECSASGRGAKPLPSASMRTSHLLIGVLALALAGGVAFAWLAPSGPGRVPELALTTLQGKQLSFAELRGRPVLVTFWSISCPSCIEDIAKLTALYEALAGRGLEIIAIAMPYDPPSHVLALSRGRQIPYPVALDIRGEAARAFGDVHLTPTTFVIAPDGRVREAHTGALDAERVRTLVLSLLPGNDTLDTPSGGG